MTLQPPDGTDDRPPSPAPERFRAEAGRVAAWVAGWTAAGLAALSPAMLPVDAGEDLCGVWGCLPPVQALAALHLFWAVAAAAVVWGVRRWRPALLLPCGTVLLTAGLIGAAAAATDVARWRAGMPERHRHLWPRRAAFTVATATDRPMVQAAAAGLAAAVLAWRRRRALTPPAGSAPAPP
jgi:hypothetical protein